MQAALRDASGKAEVGILLDYSRATLSVYLNGERLVTPERLACISLFVA